MKTADEKLSCLHMSLTLQTVFRNFYGCYNNFISSYSISLDHMLSDMFHATC
jgi:hypothetical protein